MKHTAPARRSGPLHPLVEDVRRAIKERNYADRWGALTPPRWAKYLDVRASKVNLDRILRIANTLVKDLERRRYPIELSKEDGRRSVVIILGEHVGFRVHEKLKQVTYRESIKGKGRPTDQWSTESGWAPSNLARVIFYEPPLDYDVEKVWEDGPRKGKVEDQLTAIVDDLEPLVHRRLQKRAKRDAEWAENRRRHEEAERIKREAEEVLKREADRRTHLWESARLWREVREIREFIDAVDGVGRLKGVEHFYGGLGEWLEWAREYVEEIDPLL